MEKGQVPTGRLQIVLLFSHPFGTYAFATIDPALKRWAILECHSGTTGMARRSQTIVLKI
jgi:hypothetical protein